MRKYADVFMTVSLGILCGCFASSESLEKGKKTRNDDPPPVTRSSLNQEFGQNDGLLTNLDSRGFPITDGEEIDPMVVEARRFYDTVNFPGATARSLPYPNPFTGLNDERPTAPLTFVEWKQVFGFETPYEGESLESYRARTNVVVYYNRNELGLGRELGCAMFVDGQNEDGTAILGVSCFVTNYGSAFRDAHNALQDAILGKRPKNTVCITYRPTLGVGYEVQFYVYDGNGNRQDWAQLDTHGPRPTPHVCMNCHGGHYDPERHLAKYSRFLPMDPYLLDFAKTGSGTLVDQQESIRLINVAALSTPLTPAQKQNVEALYDGEIQKHSQKAKPGYVPVVWREHSDFYNTVLKPYCLTCHLAERESLDGLAQWTYEAFSDPKNFARSPMLAWVCGNFSMPNAQPAMLAFWTTPVSIGRIQYPSAADAFLQFFQSSRSSCANYTVMSTCQRGAFPDNLCGNASSGQACHEDGRCVPQLATKAPVNPEDPTGVCKLDGSRSCPGYTHCESGDAEVQGYDGLCMPCDRGENSPTCGE